MLPLEVRPLGRGSFGRVFLGHDAQLGAQVAVKLLLDPTADIERFRREADLLVEQRANPHVVNIYRYDLSAAQPYIVMEYCEGGSLRGWVGKTGWEDAAAILLHAARGLLGIHRAGGFHRDLKPDNLLLSMAADGSGHIVKIGDFGLARRPKTVVGPMTRTPGGTEGYIAPEMDLPNAQYSAACDIWALGNHWDRADDRAPLDRSARASPPADVVPRSSPPHDVSVGAGPADGRHANRRVGEDRDGDAC